MENLNFEYLKRRILQEWNFVRVLRLLLALVITFEAFKSYDWLLGILGAILFAQAFLNAGCCGVNNCDIYQKQGKQKSSKEITDEITFEEVKHDN